MKSGLHRLPLLLFILLGTAPLLAQSGRQVIEAKNIEGFRLDGDLGEWEASSSRPIEFGKDALVTQDRSSLSRSWGGKQDLSGKLYVGFTATDLLIAGDITDDHLTTNPVLWYRGDEIEVFIDRDVSGDETETDVYNGDDYQILLFPQAPGRTWGVVRVGGRRVNSDAGFDGVRIASQRKTDEQGKYTGYTFEAAIPLANFPGLEIRAGTEIGFDLAISDADEDRTQKTYMTVGGRGGLAENPSLFGRLVFGTPPVVKEPVIESEADWRDAAIIFTATLLLIYLLWRFRRPLAILAGIPVRRKLLVMAALVVLLLLAYTIPEIMVSAERDRQAAVLEAKVELLASVLQEADREWFLGTPSTAPDPERIWALLKGGEAAPPPRYEFHPIYLRPPARSETLSGVPIVDFARTLDTGSHARFEPATATAATEVVLVCHLERDPLSRTPLEPGAEQGQVRILLEKDGQVELRSLQWMRNVDDFSATGETDAAEVAWRNPAAGTHANEIRLSGLPEDARIVAVEVVQTLKEGHLVVHGVTLLSGTGGEPIPLPLISPTRAGVPVNLWEDRPRGSSILLTPESGPLRIPLMPGADRIWFCYARPTLPDDVFGDPDGTDKISLSLVRTAGDHGESRRTPPLILKSGVHIDGEILYARWHPPDFAADLAFRWTPKNGRPYHRDIIALSAEGFDPELLEVTFLSGDDPVLAAGITQGHRLSRSATEGLDHLESVGDGTYRLSPETFADLQDVTLTWYRAGRAVLSTLGSEEGGAGLLGASLPSGALPSSPTVWEPAGPEVRALGEVRYLSTFLPVTRGAGDCVEIALKLPDAPAAERVAGVVFYVLLGVLLLTVLLVLSDLLSLLPRLRMKLTLGFAITALVPLLLFFFGLSGILERQAGRSVENALREQVGLVRRQFDDLRDEVRRGARQLLEDEDLLSALDSYDPKDYLAKTDSLVRDRAAGIAPFPGPARIYIEDLIPIDNDPGPRVFPLGTEDHPFLASSAPADDISYRWSELVLEGVATTALEEGRRTVVVEVPVGREALNALRDRLGQRYQILLYSIRGFPYLGTLVLDREGIAPRVRERKEVVQDIDLNRAPQIRNEILAGIPHVVAYDLLRTGDGDPVALVGVALPREELVAARADIRNLFFLLCAVTMLLEVIVGSILTRRITDPLTSLSRGARSVSRGQLQTRVRVTGNDELGALGKSFNLMTSELERRIGELSKLNSAIRNLSGSLDREHVLARAIEAFLEAAGGPDGLLLVQGAEDTAELVAGRVGNAEMHPGPLPLREGLVRDSLDASVPRVVTGPFEDGVEFGSPQSAATIPFEIGRDAPGAVILLYDREDPGLLSSDLEFLSTMAQQVAIALENARLYQLAIEDVATGLYVHSYFLARLREEADRAVTTGRHLTVVLVTLPDIDGVYDSYGPEDGDQVLSRAAKRVHQAIGRMNVIARADRSTIEVMLPETDKEEGIAAAGEIRMALGRRGFALKSQPDRIIQLSSLIGLATCPEDAGSAEFLLNEAHGALYKAVTDRVNAGVVDVSEERERVESRIERAAGRFVFRSEKIMELLETVERIAASDVPLLIQGETGVGKEVLAELTHEKSPRRDHPLIMVNCAALPETLLESELFGYEKGAFTGADRRKPGRFELADGGTIFLDEIGEIPPQTQVKLLRVLQDHQVERLGSTAPITVNVRVIAATNRDLQAAIPQGAFREDLYFRLNVISLVIPPLRARKEDIPVLVDHFIERYLDGHESIGKRLSPGAMDRLFAHSWPGNVRELRNTIERALVIARDEVIRADDIVFPEPPPESRPPQAREGERSRLRPTVSDEVQSPLNQRQRRLIEILMRRDSISNREYADLMGISTRTGNRDLRELIEQKLIVKVGRRRAAVYRLPS